MRGGRDALHQRPVRRCGHSAEQPLSAARLESDAALLSAASAVSYYVAMDRVTGDIQGFYCSADESARCRSGHSGCVQAHPAAADRTPALLLLCPVSAIRLSRCQSRCDVSGAAAGAAAGGEHRRLRMTSSEGDVRGIAPFPLPLLLSGRCRRSQRLARLKHAVPRATKPQRRRLTAVREARQSCCRCCAEECGSSVAAAPSTRRRWQNNNRSITAASASAAEAARRRHTQADSSATGRQQPAAGTRMMSDDCSSHLQCRQRLTQQAINASLRVQLTAAPAAALTLTQGEGQRASDTQWRSSTA